MVDIVGKSKVKLSFVISDDINAIEHPATRELVAGAGFEPAIPQARDYEPNRGRPMIW